MTNTITKKEKEHLVKKKKNLAPYNLKEKLATEGIEHLTETELLGILISSGAKEKNAISIAGEILNFCDNKIENLARMSLADLKKFRGIGEAKATMVMSALELGRRRSFQKFTRADTYKSSESIYELMKPDLADKIYEEFWVVMLNNSYRLIRKVRISKGGILGTTVDSRLVFRAAIESAAVKVVLVHNHPSGNVMPSQNDIDLTKNVVEASKVLDVNVVDHIIVSGMSYFSFADDNLIFHHPIF